MIGDVAKFAAENPQVAKAAMNILGSQSGSGGGLMDVVNSLKSGGLGDQVSSWLGSGQNNAVAPSALESALGSDRITQFAEQAGVSGSEASALLAGILPQIVDKLSPDGELPESDRLDSALGSLTAMISGRA
jgi:uncharacterized protein YidB (DUF937 family)